MNKILVTQKEYDKAAIVFEASGFHVVPVAGEERLLADAVRKHSARAVIVGVEPYVGPLYESLGEIGSKYRYEKNPGAIIARFGVGHDKIDKAAAARHGIAVVNTPGVLDRSVAEHTFWLLGALLRKITVGDAAMRDGLFPTLTGSELYGKTFLAVGFGSIGREVTKIARFGFGMRVFAAGRSPQPEEFLREHGVERYSTDVDSLLPEADVVSIHLASTPETFHYFSTSRFEKMKRTAVLLNTARGAVLDERNLVAVLNAGRITGAALDVFEAEPYVPQGDESFDLRQLSNVVLTPHLGSSSVEANRRMAESSLRNVSLFFERRFDELNRC